MGDLPTVTSSIGYVHLPEGKEVMVCQYHNMVKSQASPWYGIDPFSFNLPVLMAQFFLIFFASKFVAFFLKPLRQSAVSAQLIQAGIIMGRSFFGRNKAYYRKIFPPGGRMILETIADFGFMLHLFLVGVQTDTKLLTRARKNAIIIGSSSFLLPYALGGIVILNIAKGEVVPHSVHQALPFIVMLNSITTFPVIAGLLTDLKILNSDLGRLAISSTMVSDVCSYFVMMMMATVGVSIVHSHLEPMWNIIWFIAFIVIIMFVLRPLILQIVKHIPDGEPMKKEHFLAIVLLVLVSGLCSEALGQTAGFGTFVLGLALPDGPPVGSALVHKLDILCTGVFLLAKIVIGGLSMELHKIRGGNSTVVVEIVIVLGYIGKFVGTFVSALHYNVPFWDAFALAWVMCCKGTIEVAWYMLYKANGIIAAEEYALLLVTMLTITGVARFVVSHLYDPSRRYLAYNRNSILRSHPNSDLRILVCIHNEDNVPTIINLLEASNPTREQPLSVFVLNLMQLTGRAASILVPNHRASRGKLTSLPSQSRRIANVFNFFAQSRPGLVTVQNFTAVAPYASMHDDICMMAVDNNATIVIVPFHKQWTFDGRVMASCPSIRFVNQNVIQKSPCSVGILIDRGQMCSTQAVLAGKSSFRISMLFLGSEDDREALAYVNRMVDHPRITITVVWLKCTPQKKWTETDKTLDYELINEFRATAKAKEWIIFQEETVKDAVGTTRVLRSMEANCDLFVVGRHHEPNSPLTLGLTEWSECPELGLIGDMLASSEFQFSVLVVQQQPPARGFENKSSSGISSQRGFFPCTGVDNRVYQDPAFMDGDNKKRHHRSRPSV